MNRFRIASKTLYFVVLLMATHIKLVQGQHILPEKFKTKLSRIIDSLQLKTGDMVFFQSVVWVGKLAQLGTCSPFTHSAMVVLGEDGEPLLTHATDNNYHGYMIPVLGEEESRAGVILTKLIDLFIRTKKGNRGYYKHIWIRRLRDSKMKRPTSSDLLTLYAKYQKHPFESCYFSFWFSALDVRIGKRDLFKSPGDDKLMCSEYLALLMKDMEFPIAHDEQPSETTPVDVYKALGEYYDPPIVFGYKEGTYHLLNNP